MNVDRGWEGGDGHYTQGCSVLRGSRGMLGDRTALQGSPPGRGASRAWRALCTRLLTEHLISPGPGRTPGAGRLPPATVLFTSSTCSGSVGRELWVLDAVAPSSSPSSLSNGASGKGSPRAWIPSWMLAATSAPCPTGASFHLLRLRILVQGLAGAASWAGPVPPAPPRASHCANP